jgi:hypothetical protein
MSEICLAPVDTHINASPANITAAADWLEKLRTGFEEARTTLSKSSWDRVELTGEFGVALNEYVEDIITGCDDASSELATSIDVINSWHDQVVWRKQDMAGYRDDAKAGGLTVTSDRYIQPPEEVDNPGELPKGATAKQKSTWQTAHDNYTTYVEKMKLWNDLKSDADDTRTQLTDWVAEHMTVNPESPLYEIILSGLMSSHVTAAGILGENTYYTEAYYIVEGKAVGDATVRHMNQSKSRRKYTKDWKPNREAVAKRTNASMPARVNNANLEGKAKSIGKNLGIGLTLAIAGWDIYNGKSPSQTGIATTAGIVAGSGITIAAAALSAPAWLTVGAVVAGGTLIAWGVGEAYENWVPLRTRERIDEGIWDTWSVTSKATLWGQVFG